jgi:hypothetical protein
MRNLHRSIWLTLLLAGVALPLLSARADLLAVKGQSAQRQLLATQTNSLALNWQVSTTAGHSGGVTSAALLAIDAASGNVLATLAGGLSQGGSGPYLLSEFVELPAASVQSWQSQGARRVVLTRNFNDPTTGRVLRAQVVLNLVSSGLRAPRENLGGELLLQRLSLSFTDNQRIKVVPPDSELKAKVLLTYSGNGLLAGRWQVAEPGSSEGRPFYRTLTLVRSQLGSAQQQTLTSPLLPVGKAGKYRVRFCVTNPEMVPADGLVLDSGCPIEALTVETIYEVLGGSDPSARAIIDASPQSGAVDAETAFKWRPVDGAVVYQLQLFASSAEQPSDGEVLGESPSFVSGMLLPASISQTTLSTLLRNKLEPGGYYLWRVTAHDRNGSLIGRSQEWRVRYQP